MQSNIKFLFVGVVVLFVTTIVVGLYLGGSPSDARQVRVDGIVSSLLEGYRYEIQQYYKKEGELPSHLDDIDNTSIEYSLQRIQGRTIEYIPGNDGAYELCVYFHGNTYDVARYGIEPVRGEYPNFYRHESGRTCFHLDALSDSKEPLVD